MAQSPLTIVNQYAAAVRSGELPSCQMVRLAVERWYRDQEREDIYFDRKAFTAFHAQIDIFQNKGFFGAITKGYIFCFKWHGSTSLLLPGVPGWGVFFRSTPLWHKDSGVRTGIHWEDCLHRAGNRRWV